MTKEAIRIVKTGECLSLSGSCTLNYEIGCKDYKEVFLRLTGYTGSGIFNKVWIPVHSILSIAENPFTSGSLRELFKGKSANSGGFILAVLLAEGLLKVSEGNARHYERVDQKEYEKIIQWYTKKKKVKGVSP